MKNRAISIVTTLISTVVICSTIAAFLLILRKNSAPSDGMPPNKGVVNEVLYSPDKTTFSIWAPIADSVILSLYEGRKASTPYTILPMQRGRDGVWTRRVNGDLNGLLYSFKIMSGGEWHDDIPGIFAVATTNGGKRAAVVDMQAVNPEEWEKDTSPHIESLSDAVIMEVDTRSFSLKEENNIEYLRRIGATHINILPSFYFASIDGYRRPERMIKEFKETVMALHKAGMRVVINISYENISELALEHFKAVTPEFTPQMNEMMRRYMVESVRRWINEYHVDGFRFLQMGSHEIETLNKIRKAADAIDPNILIYGEGWRSSTHIADLNNAAIKSNTYKMVGISSFSDEFRDAITGSFAYHGSFLSGAPETRESLKFGIAGACRHPQIDFSKVNRSNRP